MSRIYYFAYGSNMLTKRMGVNISSATKYSIGSLNNYSLSYSGFSHTWKGSSANIVKQENSIIWGVIWTIDSSDVEKLDKQEFGYIGIEVDVSVAETEEVVKCRTYVQKAEYSQSNPNNIENNTIPSAVYKKVIIKGAIEHQLPEHYINSVLVSHADNGIMDCSLTNILYD